MDNTLLIAGIVCLVAAIVGGGLKFLGNEVPALSSTRRQVLLGVLGCVLLAAGAWKDLPTSTATASSNAAANAAGPAAGDAQGAVSNGSAAAATSGARQAAGSSDEAAPVAAGPVYRNRVQEAQVLLNGLGYHIRSPDGIRRPRTTEALKDFQRKENLAETGMVDERTLALLRERARGGGVSEAPVAAGQ